MIEEIKVEAGIAMPKAKKPRKFPALYTMEVGQSFAVASEKSETLHYASQHCRRATKREFAIRTVAENGQPKVRIWRTK